MREIDTFVQLFAAFYVTLSVENQIFRQFWTPAYYKTIVNLIPKYGFRYSTRFQQQFTKSIQELSRDLEAESRKKGTIMLLVCIVLLGYSVFFSSAKTPVSHSLSLITYAILALAGIVFSHYLLKRWRCVVIYGLISLFIAIAIGYIYEKWIYWIWTPQKESIVNVSKTCVISALILPIIWQLFINWLYSDVYQRHLIRLLNKEADLYSKLWAAYYRHNQEEIPSEYNSAIVAAFMNNKNGDLKVTDTINTLSKRLLDACARPKIRKLLCYIWKKCEEIRPIDVENLKNLPDADEPVPVRLVTQKGKDTRLITAVQKRTYKRTKRK